MDEVVTDPEQIVLDMADVWNTKDYARLPDLLAESVVWKEPPLIGRDDIPGPDGEAHGIEGVEAWMRVVVEEEWNNWECEMLTICSNDTEVLTEWKITGEYVPTGREVEFRSMDVWEVDDGEIKECRMYFDRLDAGEQMGII